MGGNGHKKTAIKMEELLANRILANLPPLGFCGSTIDRSRLD
jgi:hypothetical protein